MNRITYFMLEMSTDKVVFKFKCPMCNRIHEQELTRDEYERLKECDHIQNALPNRTPEEREKFLTGYCPKCQDIIFNIHDEGDEENDN